MLQMNEMFYLIKEKNFSMINVFMKKFLKRFSLSIDQEFIKENIFRQKSQNKFDFDQMKILILIKILNLLNQEVSIFHD